jgi:hypothetical protein
MSHAPPISATAATAKRAMERGTSKGRRTLPVGAAYGAFEQASIT